MLKIKKRMRQAFALIFSLFFILLPLFQAPPVFAADLCCNPGYALADGGPGAIYNCGIGPGAYDTTKCCKSNGLSAPLTQPSFACTAPPSGIPSCSWSALQNPQSVYNGKPAFCFGNFTSTADLKSHSVRVQCIGPNCGTTNLLTGSPAQETSLSDLTASQIGSSNDTNYSCITGNLDESVVKTYQGNLQLKGLSCGVALAGEGVFAVIGGAASAGLTIPITVAAAAATVAACSADITQSAAPTIIGTVLDANGNAVCHATLDVKLEVKTINDQTPTSPNAFDLCNQIPDATQKASCVACNEQNGGKPNEPKAIWTAVGCIPTTSEGIVSSVVKIALGLAGTAALLMILAGGFMLSTSQGDTKRVGEAKELITSAVIGLLFIIFSVTLLQFIGVSIFNIPGFGK